MYIYQPDRILLQKQIKEFGRYINGEVLDVGAGSFSRYSKHFIFKKYIKMDIFEGDNIDVVGKADNIPFNNEKFDSIVCTQVFEHLPDPFKAAQEIYRVLKKGGHCLVTVPQTNEAHEEPFDFFRYTQFGLKELFEKKGFKVIECVQRGGFFSLKAQLNIRYLIDRFDLYNKKVVGTIISKLLAFYGKFMQFLDRLDNSQANRKHALGWLIVLKKQ